MMQYFKSFPRQLFAMNYIYKNTNNKTRLKEKKINTVSLAMQNGYNAERHEVVTQDGYILELHRIPYGKGQLQINSKRHPVILQHGLWSSSADWIVPDPVNSLGYLLADSGFDVWFGNSRGNIFSRKHISLCAEKQSDQFWNFSFHEMGYYDLPAVIDYILRNSDDDKVSYIGHSQGTTIFFVLASTRPKYNSKIMAMIGLAPVAYMNNIKSPVLRGLITVADPLMNFTKLTGYHTFMPEKWVLNFLGELYNRNPTMTERWAATIFRSICSNACEEVQKKMLDIAVTHLSTGASIKLLVHYAQICKKEHCFRQFDYGAPMNLLKYAQSVPPDYNLQNITSPIKLFYSERDWLVHPQDVEALYKKLPNKLGLKKIPVSSFNHLDFIWSSSARQIIFHPIIELLKKTCDKS